MFKKIQDKGEIFSTTAENVKNFDFELEMKNVLMAIFFYLQALEEAMVKLKNPEDSPGNKNESEMLYINLIN